MLNRVTVPYSENNLSNSTKEFLIIMQSSINVIGSAHHFSTVSLQTAINSETEIDNETLIAFAKSERNNT